MPWPETQQALETVRVALMAMGSTEHLAKGEAKRYPYTFNSGGAARKIPYPYSFDTVTANGCLGDATQATRDKGQAMIEVCLERAAEFLDEYVG